MILNKDQLQELIVELIDFINKKVSQGDTKTTGCGDLKYPIYTTQKNKYYYRDYMIQGAIGHGILTKKDVGIAFLLGKNEIRNGAYIYLVYEYNLKEIYLKLGSSHENPDVISVDKKSSFNKKYQINYCEDFNYSEIVDAIDRLLDKFKEEIFHN